MTVRQLPFDAKAAESQVPMLQPRNLATTTMTVHGEVVREDILAHLHDLRPLRWKRRLRSRLAIAGRVCRTLLR